MSRPKKHQKINVRVFYPATEEGMIELRTSLARTMLDITREQLGEERFSEFIEYANKKINGKL